MPETPSEQQPYEVAAASYKQLMPVPLDNAALASGKLNITYARLSRQILGIDPAIPPEVAQITLKPDNLHPEEFERMQQAVLLVFRQLNKGYEKIRANRQNPKFSLSTSDASAHVELDKFNKNFIPEARLQVLQLVSSDAGQWYISQAAREQLVQAFNFVQSILLATNNNHAILRELNRYPGAVARDLGLQVADRVRLGLTEPVNDPRYFGLADALPDEYRRRSVTEQTGAPSRAEERGRLPGDDYSAPGRPLQVPRSPKP